MTMESNTRQSIIKEVGQWFDDLSHEFPNDEIFGTVIRGMIQRLKQGEIPPRKMPQVATSQLGEGVRQVFSEIDKIRGYRPPKRNAEAASILRMLKKDFTPEQIIECWKTLKQDKFWSERELFLMTIETQIGAMINKQSVKRDYSKGKYAHLVRR